MISRFDDYCLHQSPAYLRVPATTDRNFYDRYFFCGYSADASLMFGVSFARYPNRYVQDAHFTVVRGAVQTSLHASDVLAGDPAQNVVGPLEVEIVEPMRILRCRVLRGEHGIACDLTFRAVTGAIDEGRLVRAREDLVYIDQTRFMQYGAWAGWIEVDGVRQEVGAGVTFGLRDKSWGVRLIGEHQVTHRRGEQIFWMNVVMLLGREHSVIRTLDRADGSSIERTGYFVPVYASAELTPVGEKNLLPIATWSFDLDFVPGTRRIARGRYGVRRPDGSERRIEGRVLGTFWYAGMGYSHDRWNHGSDHGGRLVIEREDWRTDEVDPARLDRQFMASVMEFSEEGRIVGLGHTEQLLMGQYVPFGWGPRDYLESGATGSGAP
ncbi:MAG: hypothetical protein IPI06_09620 [Gammaproteobacteria bacterium]|nr:hypothetical protein [Gammaproteobacteria bacterium]